MSSSMQRLGKQCAAAVGKASTSAELFSQEDLRQTTATGARIALIEAAEAAIIADPAAAAAAGVDKILWKVAFHSTVAHYRKLAPAAQSASDLAEFLNGALGLYEGLLDVLDVSPLGFRAVEPEPDADGILHPRPDNAAAVTAMAQRIFISMGDIARYQALLLPAAGHGRGVAVRVRLRWSLSASLYRRASELNPHDGTPYNQLGVLASSMPDDPYAEVRAVSHYFQSLTSATPCPTTAANLEALLRRQPRRSSSATIPPIANVPAAWKQLPELGRHFSAGLLKLYDTLQNKGDLEWTTSTTAAVTLESIVDLFRWVLQASWLHLALVTANNAVVHSAAGQAADAARLGPSEILHILFTTSVLASKLSGPAGSVRHAAFADTVHTRIITEFAAFLAQLVAEHDRSGLGRAVCGPYIAPFKVALDLLAANPNPETHSADARPHMWNSIALALNAVVALPASRVQPSAVALPEDVELRGLGSLRHLHASLDFAPHARAAGLSNENGNRAAVIRKRGLQLAASLNAGLRVDPVTDSFVVQMCDATGKVGVVTPALSPQMVLSADVFDDRKFKAHGTRLVDEGMGRHDYHPLNQLSGAPDGQASSNRPGRRMPAAPPVIPTTVVVDTECLLGGLQTIEQMVASQKFNIVVPMAVYGALESRARENATGRKARVAEGIRFLESVGALPSGAGDGDATPPKNTAVRLQLRDESADLLVPAPSTALSEHVRLVSCCTYFAESTRNRPDRVVLLSSDAPLVKLARSAGIVTQTTGHFAPAHGVAIPVRQKQQRHRQSDAAAGAKSQGGRRKPTKNTSDSPKRVHTIQRDRK
eukprot:m.203200 g.203200  ORF g.203200 m.203200 type:complete len:823 (-) comp25263_c1_seq1:56-2524(-)